jgi:hypothetical protein
MIVLAVVASIHQQHSETVPYSIADMCCETTTISSASLCASSRLHVLTGRDEDFIVLAAGDTHSSESRSRTHFVRDDCSTLQSA